MWSLPWEGWTIQCSGLNKDNFVWSWLHQIGSKIPRTWCHSKMRSPGHVPVQNTLWCWQDKKEELRVEQAQSFERSTELETLLNTNLLRQQQELQDRLSKADVSVDRCVHAPSPTTPAARCSPCPSRE